MRLGDGITNLIGGNPPNTRKRCDARRVPRGERAQNRYKKKKGTSYDLIRVREGGKPAENGSLAWSSLFQSSSNESKGGKQRGRKKNQATKYKRTQGKNKTS